MNEEKILCWIEKIIYQNEATGYIVFFCSTNKEIPSGAIDKKSSPKHGKYGFTVVTSDISNVKFQKRLQYKFEGEWISSKYGLQFKGRSFEVHVEEGKESIQTFLTTIPGIGPKVAARIYDCFGNDTLNIIRDRESIKQLSRVKGISSAKADDIWVSIQMSENYRTVAKFFSEFSISPKKVKRIYEILGEKSIDSVKENPFILCEMAGVDFLTANGIACDTKTGLSSESRIEYALFWTHNSYFRNAGHLYEPAIELINKSYQVLNNGFTFPVVTQKNIIDVLGELISRERFIVQKMDGHKYIYLKNDYICEKKTAVRIVDFVKNKTISSLPEKTIRDDIEECQNNMNLILSNKQKEAVVRSINNNFSIITGGPGTGKTTILKVILYIYKKNFGGSIGLCAPTGRAARRMSESTSLMGASTIHNLLVIGEDYSWSEESTNTVLVDKDLLVVDEASMIDMELFYLLMQSTSFSTKVIMLGDADQLPSVGPGNALREIISSKVVPVTTLDKIYRQSDTSKIIINAHKIRELDTNYEYDNQFKFYEINDIDAVEKEIVNLFFDELSKTDGNLDNIQILTPFKSSKKRASVPVFNEIIQNKINPRGPLTKEIKVNKISFRIGDKVIQQKNTADIKNGDIGYVNDIIKNSDGVYIAVIDFGDGRIVNYSKYELEENIVNLAYAITIHKSQGSEYKTVIMPIIPEHEFFLNKNLIYTAWTRAKQNVFLVGSETSLRKKAVISNIDSRNTLLSQRMIARNARYNKKNTK